MAARRGECAEASQAWILLEISFCFISNYFSLPTTSRDGCLARAAHPSSHPSSHPSIPPSHGTWKAVLAIPPESTRYTTEPCRCHSVPAVISRAKRVYRLNPSTCTYGGGTPARSPHTQHTTHPRRAGFPPNPLPFSGPLPKIPVAEAARSLQRGWCVKRAGGGRNYWPCVPPPPVAVPQYRSTPYSLHGTTQGAQGMGPRAWHGACPGGA